ncbi:aldehyde dehydrogenase family protein [Deltaproteobacteria bacterium TL4]
MTTAPKSSKTSISYPKFIKCTNPATGESIGTVPCLPLQNMPQVMQKARVAQKEWAAYGFDQRRPYLIKIRDYMNKNSESIAAVIAKSTGKTQSAAMVEVLFSISAADWYLNNAQKYLKTQTIPVATLLLANKRSYLQREPLGVVGILTPWNYPFLLAMNEIIMGLAAGNAILFKVAEETAMVGVEMEKALNCAKLPEGLTQFMVGIPSSISTAWFENGIDKIFFTGSVRVGKLLMRQAAETLTPVSMELGGNDAMIVMADANLKRAANGATWAGFFNSGQTCSGVERIYVHEKVAAEFIGLMKENVSKLRQGIDRGKFDTDVGSMTVSRQVETVKRHVEDALKKGAKIAAQAPLRDDGGMNFYPATVLTGMTHDMVYMKEETFGPVVGIMTFKDEQEALALANDSDLGLTASIWSMDTDNARKMASELQTGSVTINDHMITAGMAELPWSGRKNSGLGVTHSHLGLEEMTHPKVITYDLTPQLKANLWWFPESKAVYRTFLTAFRFLYRKGK